MATANEFVDGATIIWKNHSIYLWGGNGEYTKELRIKQIYSQEQSMHDAARVLRHIAELLDNGYDLSKSRAVDCSGLAIAILRDLKCIKATEDYRARDLQAMCKKIKLDKLKAGNCVFNKESGATHMGIYVGYDMVIEAQGRDVGVVKRKLDQGNWVIGGRLPYFS